MTDFQASGLWSDWGFAVKVLVLEHTSSYVTKFVSIRTIALRIWMGKNRCGRVEIYGWTGKK